MVTTYTDGDCTYTYTALTYLLIVVAIFPNKY